MLRFPRILLRSERHRVFRGLYIVPWTSPSDDIAPGESNETEVAVRVYGEGPRQLFNFMFSHYFKYDSAGKRFIGMQTPRLTPTTDAVALMPKQRWANHGMSGY
jgi:hypothetical protein